MSEDTTQADLIRRTRLLEDVLNLFETFGVKPSVGQDGMLMKRIQEEISGYVPAASFKIKSSKCPICGNPDYTQCDCPVDEVMARMEL